MRYSEDVIEEVRMKNDIVDVISGYPPRFPCRRGSRCIIVLAAVQGDM